MTSRRLFRYYPDDFGELRFSVIHMDLCFDVYDEHTSVVSDLHARNLEEPLTKISLNAKDLEITAVGCPEVPVSFNYDKEASLLWITFSEPIMPGSEFTIHTETICHPSTHILEGLYYDETPAGAPPQQITQCQQWGFQRIVPCIDDMCAKCTYTTTIHADERYTSLITNGDVSRPRNPLGDHRVSITYENSVTPMAPYLFFLGVGTYDTFRRRFEYPDGNVFSIELLVPPGSEPEPAEQALEMIADGALWVYLFTGPDRYETPAIRHEIYDLCHRRDSLIREAGSPDEIAAIKERCRELVQMIHPGYQYTGTVYREIGMQNSDFGGMENVGNTTITTNRIMPFRNITDSAYEYMIRVKVHEYYHNINGSEVTGASPFEIWLNEAVTVHIENQYHAFLFGESYSRLQTVLELLSPMGGTFFYDRGAGSMPIEPDGFNDPNDLITSVTYVKSPEFVRMIETLMGKEAFVRALDHYHEKYSHSNATGVQWLKEMEKESGLSFTSMAEGWLKQRGYPLITVDSEYDNVSRRLTLSISQRGPEKGQCWEFPFSVVCVDENGRDYTEKSAWIKSPVSALTIDGVNRPAYLSLNRGYGIYAKTTDSAGTEELLMQARTDSDLINRYCAFNRLAGSEMLRLLNDPEAAVSDGFTELCYDLISDNALMEETGGQFLTIFESVDDETETHHYRKLYDAKQRIYRAFAGRYLEELTALYQHYEKEISGETDLASRVCDMKLRQVMNTCLVLLSSLDTHETQSLALRQFERAENASEKLTAFSCYLNSSADDKMAVLERFWKDSECDLVSWENFLATVALSDSADLVSILKDIESSPSFRLEQANDQRALYVRFAYNRKISLQTSEGRAFLLESLQRLGTVNEYSTVNALSVFGNIDLMEKEYHIPLIDLLVNLRNSLDPAKSPSVCNTIRRLLIGAPESISEYEKETGVRVIGD